MRHTFADDIKSLFYMFIWIVIHYNGPLGRERPDSMIFTYDRSVLSAWTEQALDDLGRALDSKITFLVDPKALLLRREISPYFSDLFDLGDNWRKLHGKAYYTDGSIEFDEVAAVLDKFITTMPDDEKSPEFETVALQLQEDSTIVTQKYSLWKPNQADGNLEMPPKHLRDDVRSMDNAPLPYKQFKRSA